LNTISGAAIASAVLQTKVTIPPRFRFGRLHAIAMTRL
jgi:hypothetical protein